MPLGYLQFCLAESPLILATKLNKNMDNFIFIFTFFCQKYFGGLDILGN
jgi:hypothetical protein